MPSPFLCFFCFFLFWAVTAVEADPNLPADFNACSAPAGVAAACPPFSSTPTFPFAAVSASTSGYYRCGHPGFQIHCSSPHSLISIGHFSFYILHQQQQQNPHQNQISLLPISDDPHQNQHPHCSSLPRRQIDLSNSPFRFSPSTCSRLSLLQPCPFTNRSHSLSFFANNCSLNKWQRRLLFHPLLLLQGCPPPSPLYGPCNNRDANNSVANLVGYLRSGLQVEWDENDAYFSDCSVCQSEKRGLCGFNVSDAQKQFFCFQSSRGNKSTESPSTRANPNKLLLFVEICCAMVALLCLLLLVAMILRYKGRVATAAEEDPSILIQKDALLLRRLHSDLHPAKLPPIFTYEELELSTNGFDHRRKLGDGGFGSVYLGQLRDGQIVAVKRLYKHHSGKARSFCNEILILSNIDHPNLVKLHGYCSDPRGLLLVYEYISNGTLADHLHGQLRKCNGKNNSLTLEVRLQMALQTAMAIEYLHFWMKPPVVHRDVTSSNIFVERDMKVKLGDFGLSRLLVSPVMTGPQGTPGYVDPDYHRSFRLTEKSDVYSFGVVLFELISGMKAVDVEKGREEVGLAELMVGKIQAGALLDVVDPVLVMGGGGGDVVRGLAELGFRCVAAHKDDRPDMNEVVMHLKQIQSRFPLLL